MVNFSQDEYNRHLQKEARRKPSADTHEQLLKKVGNAVRNELDLHAEIIKHCYAQHPRWRFIRSRSDQPSGIAVGAQDFTIFLPRGRVLCIECKSKVGKLDEDQVIWSHELARCGHTVHVVRSMEEFLKLVNA